MTESHPSGDRDLEPANYDELCCGYTGDAITIETLGDFSRPVADFSVSRPSVFCKMMPATQWDQYCTKYPHYSKGVQRPAGLARTGTSLGYKALWVQPYIEAEYVSDDDGVIVAAWVGPDGKSYAYDAEHVVDPACEIVKRLEREQGFDPETLGGQHYAVALETMTGRGGQQSELLRVSDAQWIGADPTRGRVTFQVPRAMRMADMNWVVGASRDLPLEEGNRAWDGAAAAESIFAGAGWPNNPDPAAARQGFLFYDASAPKLKGSYKDPIARRSDDGQLRVPKSGLDAAASAIPKTDVPQDVQERGRSVVEHYQAKFERAQPSRDARDSGKVTMATRSIMFGIRDRSTLDTLKQLGIAVPAVTKTTLDEANAAELEPLVMQLQELVTALAMKLQASTEKNEAMDMEMAGMKEKMADMPSVEEAQKSLEVAQKALEAAKAAEAEAKKTSDELAAKVVGNDETIKQLTATVDQLEAELVPVRAAQLADFRTQLVAAGLDKAKAQSCSDAASLRRAFVVARVSDSYAKQDDAKEYVHDDAAIERTFDGAWGVLKASTGNANDDTSYAPGPGLRMVPSPTIPTPDVQDDAPDQSLLTPSTTTLIGAGL